MLKFDNIKFSHLGCNSEASRCSHYVKSESGYKGVEIYKDHGKKRTKIYRATVRSSRKRINLGAFKTAKEAAEAYDKAAVEMFGDRAVTNRMLGLLS